MKKALVILVLLLAIGGAVFYRGWVQILIPEDHVAVAFSRTGGWEPEVLRAGEFNWRWEHVPPGNMQLYLFSRETHALELSKSGSLPSGEVFQQYLEGNPSLDYNLGLELQVRLQADELPRLAEERGVRPDAIETYLEELGGEVERLSLEFLSEYFSDAPEAETVSELLSQIEDELESLIQSRYAELEVVSFRVRELQLPDLALYRMGREIYLDIVAAQREAIIQAQAEMAVTEVTEAQKIEVLERFGRLLSDYPVLLEYFALGGDVGDPLNLRELQLLEQMQ